VPLAPCAPRFATPVLREVASWGGPALALAWLLARPAGARAEPHLALSVGAGVRRGLPTAARATLLARSPLTGRVATGQVGSALARRLAAYADALVLFGRVRVPRVVGAVLHLAPGGAELRDLPELAGADPARVQSVLERELGPCAVLRCGPAGERGVPFANLAAGSDPPSFVGRGGLGAVLGALGLKALALTFPEIELQAERAATAEALALGAALAASPRLRARAEGGTFELFHALEVRGEPGGERARRTGQQASAAPKSRHGCKGCPTPCGWAFDAGPGQHSGERQGARFSAVHALGLELGLEGLDGPLALLDDCNRLGLDAKEAGACLAVLARAVEDGRLAGPRLLGERDALRAELADLASGRGRGGRARNGAAALEGELGVPRAASVVVRGEAGRRERNLAAVLGQFVGARGAEPMRTFPFLSADAASRARLEELLAPTPVPAGTEDPFDPAGKGRLVWWHENLSNAIDATGFCAFSAAGLLADGACDVDALARWVAPPRMLALEGARSPGESLLAAGATLALLYRELELAYGGEAREPEGWASESLARPGMLAEYRRFRGLDARGRPTARARASLATAAAARAPAGERAGPPRRAPRAPAGAPRAGTVHVRCAGSLARALGADLAFATTLPARVLDVLARLAEERPEAAGLLVREALPVPVVYRAGARLEADEWLRDGDRVELLVAVAGG